MARSIGGTDLINFGSGTLISNVAPPYTIAFWYKRAANTATNNFFSKGVGTLYCSDNSASVNNQLRFVRDTSSTPIDARSNATLATTDGWAHIAITVSSGWLASIYKNGSQSTYNLQWSGNGSFVSDAASNLVFDGSQQVGSVCEFAWWNTLLSDDNINNLASGRLPQNVHSANMICHAPLRGDTPEPELVGGTNLVLTGTTVVSNPSGLDATGVSSLAAGTASFNSSGPGGGTPFIKVTSTDATNGTAPYSYQWQRNLDGGTYSNVTNATGLSLTDSTVSYNHLYGYKLSFTDAASQTVTSNAVTAQAYSGGPIPTGSTTTTIFGFPTSRIFGGF